MGKKLLFLVCLIFLVGAVGITARAQTEVEIAYDDGSQEQAWTGGIAGYVMAVCFTPSQYPCTVKRARFFMNSVGYSFKVHVYQQANASTAPGLDLVQSFIVQPSVTGWYSVELSQYNITITSGNFAIGIEYTSPMGPGIGSDFDPPIANRSWDYIFADANWVLFAENYMIRATVEYPTVVTSTTTTALGGICRVCPILCGLGADSEETALLRTFRDEVLSKTAEGREIIKLYYQWGPLVARAMEADEEFKADVTEIIEEILPIVGESVE
jgi:hypothetical protein